MQEYKLPTTLILDLSKWRCGGGIGMGGGLGITWLGASETMLLNAGLQCCLGQFSEQAGVPLSHLDMRCRLRDLQVPVECLSVMSCGRPVETDVSAALVSINDSAATSIAQKISSIRRELRWIDREVIVTAGTREFVNDYPKLISELVNGGILSECQVCGIYHSEGLCDDEPKEYQEAQRHCLCAILAEAI